MAVTYKKLFHLLIDKGMTNAELMEKAGFSANIITRIKRDNYISLDSIEKICKTLGCGVDDTFISAIKKLAIKEVVLYSDRKIAATKELVSKNNQLNS